MDQELVAKTRKLLRALSERISPTYFSIEKQMYIGKEIISKLPDEGKLLLRNYMNQCLSHMRKIGASDIDLGGWGANRMIWFRVQGTKGPYPDAGTFDYSETDILIQNLLMEMQREYLYQNKNLDFSYMFNDGDGTIYRNRADAYFDMDALALNMRAIHTEIRIYSGYGFHPNVTRTLSLEYTKEGLILLTGITGSGKSTTLDSILNLNNETVRAHIVIIASPVEYVHSSKKCIIRHREIGRDTTSFRQGTVEALRQDPDIIVIGEMRDPQTIVAALEAADSGHKVLSTLHTSSAVESIDRIIAEVPPQEQERVKHRLADVLRCVISQKLVPGIDGKLILAKEVMVMIPSIRSAIKGDNTEEIYQMISEGQKYGMITMEQDLMRLFDLRKISKENAVNYSNNKRRMQQLLKAV